MDAATLETVVETAASLEGIRIDITGGAAEMHPRFRQFISALRELGRPVQVRTNLTALLRPEQEGLMEFLRENDVDLVASLPCYTEENVRAQRGEGVFEASLEALRRLNALGYGREGGPALDLSHNPGGAVLPIDQSAVEADYRRELGERFGIVFRRLYTIVNMPIGRFGSKLKREGGRRTYMRTLREAFNPDTLPGLMCRRQICVDWDGTLYDCDFNLALRLAVNHGAPDRIEAFDSRRLCPRRIVTGEHCFCCTAGHGSSCGGALA
jgi:radical SAM/Cys-rich protein